MECDSEAESLSDPSGRNSDLYAVIFDDTFGTQKQKSKINDVDIFLPYKNLVK